MKKWISVEYKLPKEGEWVSVRREDSYWVGGFREIENVVWESVGRYRKYKGKVIWTIKNTDKLTFENSEPHFWRELSHNSHLDK